MVVSILAGVNADGSAEHDARRPLVSRSRSRPASPATRSSCSCRTRCRRPRRVATTSSRSRAASQNNTIAGNTLDLTGKSSTGIKLDGEDYGTTIVGNHFIGGTIYDDGYNGTAIILGAAIGSAGSQGGAFPLPEGWTALPSLGAVIEDNTIQDSLGGIQIGVEHNVNYWASQVTSTSLTGRVFVSATVTGNTFEFDSAFLQAWASAVRRRGQRPRAVLDAPDHHDRQRLELRGPRARRQPAIPLDRRRCDDPLRQRPARSSSTRPRTS